jgi:hypothetical protein
MIVPHPFDIIAILLGIFLALRRSDVRAYEASRYPRVATADFVRWQDRASAAYALGTRACFAKVIADFAYLAFLQHTAPMPLPLQRGIGVSLDLAWVGLLLVCWVRARRARRFAEQLGIPLHAPSAQDVNDRA